MALSAHEVFKAVATMAAGKLNTLQLKMLKEIAFSGPAGIKEPDLAAKLGVSNRAVGQNCRRVEDRVKETCPAMPFSLILQYERPPNDKSFTLIPGSFIWRMITIA